MPRDFPSPPGPEEFRARRQQLGFSQRALGQAIGRTREHIVEYEAGRAAIPPAIWLALEALENRKAMAAIG